MYNFLGGEDSFTTAKPFYYLQPRPLVPVARYNLQRDLSNLNMLNAKKSMMFLIKSKASKDLMITSDRAPDPNDSV